MERTECLLTRELNADEECLAAEIHQRSLVVDTCGALPAGRAGDLDESIAELRLGGVDVVGMTLSAEEHDLPAALAQIKHWNRVIDGHCRDLVKVTCADDIRQAHADGRIGVYYIFQNAKPFEDDPGNVRLFRDMGVTSAAVTYNKRNFLGDGCQEPENSGISTTGRDMIAAMNRAGMLVDLSHGGKRTQLTAAQASESSPYFSHNNAFSVCENRRNATDETMRVVSAKGGILCVMPLELCGEDADSRHASPTVRDMADHIVHALNVMGEDGVGIASDFPKGRKAVYETAFIDQDDYFNIQYDGTLHVKRTRWGGPGTLMTYPWWDYATGFRSYRDYPNITRELVARRIDPQVIAKVLGLNFLELYAKVVG